MTAPNLPPGVVERWTFYTAWMDGPWVASTGRWEEPMGAARAAAAWILICAETNQFPRVRVQTVNEVPCGD